VQASDWTASSIKSGPTSDSFGSMLELSWGGRNPINLNDGSTRAFIQDVEMVTIRGWAGEHEGRVGFGEVSGQVVGVR